MLVAATAERERLTSTTALRRASGSICGTNRREERPGRVPNRDGGGQATCTRSHAGGCQSRTPAARLLRAAASSGGGQLKKI